MLTLEEIRKKKESFGYTNEQLARLSGVPLGTLQKVMGNVTKSPRYRTLAALSAVFETIADKPVNSKMSGRYYYEGDNSDISLIKEPEPAYNINPRIVAANWSNYDRQGTYTLEDYLALPDDQRVELIDGVIYDMGSPTSPHQLIAGEIHRQIANYIRENKGSCIPFMAPTDVQLACDNRTIVQPDVLVVCDRSKINRNRIFGAPDFVAEVLSPSTKSKDIFIKTQKYFYAGVKEYWLVDPMKETVTAYYFQNDDVNLKLYSFEDSVPVMLYDGAVSIDFKEIKDYISFITKE